MSGLTGDWSKIEDVFNPFRIKSELKKATGKAGIYGASEIRRGIRSGAPGGEKFVPLSGYTTARKGSTKPLIDKGDLIGSVSYKVVDDDNVFIGVKKGSEVSIAAVHEFGCTIQVTPKMRAYFHYNGLHLKATTQFINIPPRPFLRPILQSEKFQNKISEIYLEALRGAFS